MAPYDSVQHLKSMKSLNIADMYSVKGKVCLVTGGSRGIGMMIAKGFVENGAKVYVASRKKEVCDQVAAELNKIGPGNAVGIAANLTSDEACKALATEIGKMEDKLDVLVNNAGATWGDSFDDFPEAAWERVFTLNVYSIWHLTRAFTPMLKKASNGNLDPAHVINVSSVGGAFGVDSPFSNNPSYLTSKAACNKLTKTLAAYLVKDGINVNCIGPGVFESKMTFDYQLKDDELADIANKSYPVGRYGNETDMASLAIYLSSKASAFMTGGIFYLDGGSLSISRM